VVDVLTKGEYVIVKDCGFAWCKINPRGGERAIQSLEPVVNPPAGCDLKL